MFNNGHTFMLVVVEKFSKFARAESLKNKTDKSIIEAFAKIINRGELKTLFLYTDRGLEFVNKLYQRYPKKKRINFFNGTKSRNEIFHRRAKDQNAFVSNLAILHIQRHRKIRRRASGFSRSYNATFHGSIKRSHHRRLSHNQLAIVQQIGHLSATA